MNNFTNQGPKNLEVCKTKRKIDKCKTNQDFRIQQNLSKQLRMNLEQKFKYSDFMTWIKLDFKVQFISDYKAGYDN